MKKSDLKTGMRVLTKGGDLYLVLRDCETEFYGHQKIFLAGFHGGFMIGDSFNDDLTVGGFTDDSFTINRVYIPSSRGGVCGGDVLDPEAKALVWERDTPREMKLGEIEKLLGYRIKVVE